LQINSWNSDKSVKTVGFYLDDFTLFERTKIFQESLNTNAAVVGKYLAGQWRLPSTIESGIEHSIYP